MDEFLEFIERLRGLPRLVIQAHDFPDHDAVSSAFALAYLLEQFSIPTLMVYNGFIDRVSLRNMIDWLQIPLVHWKDSDLGEADKILTVDGCIGEKNVMDLPGDEIAVIDHHQTTPPAGLWYQDVRPHYGACASILHEYYDALGIELPRDVATALQVGLAVDTANLTRGFQQADVQAFGRFHACGDTELVNRICRNTLMRSEMAYYRLALDVIEEHGRVAFAYLPEDCPKNLLGMLGDFLLSVDEYDVVILAAPAGDVINLSLRSEDPAVNCGRLVRKVLLEHKLGFGGGHGHMAGGTIRRAYFNDSDPGVALRKRFLRELFPATAATPLAGQGGAAAAA